MEHATAEATKPDPGQEGTSYLLHGVRIDVHSSDPELLDAFHGLFARYALDVQSRSHIHRLVDCTLRAAGRIDEDGAIEGQFFDEDGLQCGYAGATITLRARGIGVARANLSTGSIHVDTLGKPADSSWSIQHFLILPMVMEYLRLEGIHPIHAAAVELDGVALLLPAAPGSGKSTLSIALLRSGARLLSDDMPLATTRSGQAEILAFPEDINVCDGGTGFFPELEFLKGKHPNERKKHSFPAEQLYRNGIAESALPRLLVFPSIANAATSTLAPIGHGEAFTEFLRHCQPPLNRSLAREHFQTMMETVSHCECYSLAAGKEPNEAARLLMSLLRRELDGGDGQRDEST